MSKTYSTLEESSFSIGPSHTPAPIGHDEKTIKKTYRWGLFFIALGKQQKNVNFTKLGIIFFIIAIAVPFAVVKVIQKGLEDSASVKTPEQDIDAYNNFVGSLESDPADQAPIYMESYLYNLTNAYDVVVTGAIPIVEELGPYTYQLKARKLNVSFSDDLSTVSWQSFEQFTFIPSLSITKTGRQLNNDDKFTTLWVTWEAGLFTTTGDAHIIALAGGSGYFNKTYSSLTSSQRDVFVRQFATNYLGSSRSEVLGSMGMISDKYDLDYAYWLNSQNYANVSSLLLTPGQAEAMLFGTYGFFNPRVETFPGFPIVAGPLVYYGAIIKGQDPILFYQGIFWADLGLTVEQIQAFYAWYCSEISNKLFIDKFLSAVVAAGTLIPDTANPHQPFPYLPGGPRFAQRTAFEALYFYMDPIGGIDTSFFSSTPSEEYVYSQPPKINEVGTGQGPRAHLLNRVIRSNSNYLKLDAKNATNGRKGYWCGGDMNFYELESLASPQLSPGKLTGAGFNIESCT